MIFNGPIHKSFAKEKKDYGNQFYKRTINLNSKISLLVNEKTINHEEK